MLEGGQEQSHGPFRDNLPILKLDTEDLQLKQEMYAAAKTGWQSDRIKSRSSLRSRQPRR